ncbi:hypothetical protein llap_9586 [Limosa lapponica baueri]|uniref:Heat shock 70 kDa protein 13 n=1 Tax=Limosa lapponica baueri TaxID=1758121 RepID=A0A2I0U2C1_LIMLA|nr:hypothetical protein llap_9586 [Limosa lapponica baueri]
MPTPKVIGIDLGTTYCSVGVFLPGTGQVKVIADENGHNSIPSIVSFTDKGVYVGYDGLELADSNPQNTIYDAKRFIGKIFTSEELKSESSRYPFKVCSHLLQISPSRLEILRVINEPTAAAMAYGLHKADVFNVLVVDLGGGTLDVSLLNKQGGLFLTRAMAGNNKLGGQDFNQRLMLYLYDQLHQTYGSLPTRKEEIHRLRQAVEAVKLNLTVREAATLRVLLTMPERKLTKERPENEVKTNTVLKGKPSPKPEDLKNLGDASKGENNFVKVVFETEISRKLFEMLNEDLFEKILVPIEQVLKEGHLHKAEVDEIVLVGGSTRIPQIRKVIQDFFGKEPNTSVDPDLAVVMGVAIQAGIVGGSWPLQVSAIEIPNKNLRKTNFN